MLIKILGCGTILSPGTKNCTGFLIGRNILIDCGPGIWRALGLNGIEIDEIELILLSHFHPDHIGDIPAIFLQKYLQNKDRKLVIAGPNSIDHWYTKLVSLYGGWIKELAIECIPISEKVYSYGKYKIESGFTGHTKDSICLKITDESNKSLFYSGDSDYNEELIRVGRNCDAGIIEASNTIETKIEGHMTPQLAAQMALNSGIKKLILTHHYPEVMNTDYQKDVSDIFLGEIITARDNMEILL